MSTPGEDELFVARWLVPEGRELSSYWKSAKAKLNEQSERSEQKRLALLIQRIGSYLGQPINLHDFPSPLGAAKHIHTMFERGCSEEEVSYFLMNWRPTKEEKKNFGWKKPNYGKNRVANDLPLVALGLFHRGKSWPAVMDDLIAAGLHKCKLTDHSSDSNCCKNLEGSIEELRAFLRELRSEFSICQP